MTMGLLDEIKRAFQPNDDEVEELDEASAEKVRMALYRSRRPADEDRSMSLEEGLRQARRKR